MEGRDRLATGRSGEESLAGCSGDAGRATCAGRSGEAVLASCTGECARSGEEALVATGESVRAKVTVSGTTTRILSTGSGDLRSTIGLAMQGVLWASLSDRGAWVGEALWRDAPRTSAGVT